MFIKKNYNVKSLAETLEGALSVAIDDGEITVEIGLLEASEILDVLNEINKREQKHQTLESACNFMEMEDGTQTNEMELHNKKDANGNILRSMDCNLDEIERGNCFGCHIGGDGKCNLCVYERECMNETKERERCFGKSYGKRPIVVCGTCKYAKRCEILTKHE
nr:MAG TPA: hypothetical protein [Caudoviricetes sp.]